MLDEQIDENLRRVYGQTLNQPLPDKFTQLLDKLRQHEKKSSPSTEHDSQTVNGESQKSDGDDA